MTGEPGAAAERTAEVGGPGGAEAVPSGARAAASAADTAGGTETGTAPGAAGAVSGTEAAPTGEPSGAPSSTPTGTDNGADSGAAQAAGGAQARRSRRFPLFTKDTARPEGGGRAAPSDAPAPARQWPVLAVLLVVGIGLLITALDLFRAGTLLVGLGLIGGALMRWALPSVGMLAVRSRFTDMVTYGVLGTVIALLAMMAQPHPWLEIPFLDDTLHFTIS